MEVKVLGPGCPKCKKLYEEVQKAVAQAGLSGVSVRKVEAIADIVAHGVMMTPALVVDGVVKSQGTIPESREIAQWLTTAAAREG